MEGQRKEHLLLYRMGEYILFHNPPPPKKKFEDWAFGQLGWNALVLSIQTGQGTCESLRAHISRLDTAIWGCVSGQVH